MRKIKIATLFSGIGAIEQAFIKLGLDIDIVFACDNGENELDLLENKDIQEKYNKLKKKTVNKLSLEEKEQLHLYKEEELSICDLILNDVKHLKNKDEKRKMIELLYKNHSKGKGKNLVKDSYLANYNINPKNFFWDIRFLDGCDYTNQVDIMCGGSPCQSFSSNGKRGGFEDTRGTLFHDYARIISEVQPKCFIFENVKGMLVHDEGRTWQTIKNVFHDLNYNIYINKDDKGNEIAVLNALDYGIPQQRERIYLIGIKNDIHLRKDFQFPKPIRLTTTNKDFLDSEVPAKYYLGQKGFEFVTTHPSRAQVGRTIQKCQKANQQFNWNGDFIFEPLSKKHTKEILAKAYVGEWNGQRGVIRMYTPRECLRLMGFPDSFRMVHSDNVMWRQSGNSIVVNVLEEIIKELIKTGIFD